MAIGNLNIVGIARRAKDEKKHWTSVAELTKKTGEFLALAISTSGAILAFIGFLSSWLIINISNAYELGLQGLNGTQTGFGLIVRSILGAYQVFQVERGGTIYVGAFLLVFALLVFLIFVALLLSALSASGIIATQFGYAKRETQQLMRQTVFLGSIAFLLVCILFIGVQAASNRIEITGLSQVFQFSLQVTIHFANGFWFSFWGLFFTVFGYLVSQRLLGKYVYWVEKLTMLDPEKHDRWYLMK
jgi:hypothetical protein